MLFRAYCSCFVAAWLWLKRWQKRCSSNKRKDCENEKKKSGQTRKDEVQRIGRQNGRKAVFCTTRDKSVKRGSDSIARSTRRKKNCSIVLNPLPKKKKHHKLLFILSGQGHNAVCQLPRIALQTCRSNFVSVYTHIYNKALTIIPLFCFLFH